MLKVIVKTFLNSNNINVNFRRFAGHSKWQNIRHIKGIKDAQKSEMFTKLSRQIRVAVQEGGGSIEPKNNLKLDQIIAQAKRINMPAATIQSVLKSCQADKTQCKTYLFEIKGPGSCFILCEVFTHHQHVFKQNLATILRKHQSKFSDGGMHLFQEKGIIEAEVKDIEADKIGAILEIATDHAIEAGAEDVQILEDNILEFTCGNTNLNSVVNNLQNNYNIISASVDFVPLKLQILQDSELQVFYKLCEKLSSLPEVVRIFDNVQ